MAACVLAVVFSTSSLAVAPYLGNGSGSVRLPDSPVALWKIEIQRESGRWLSNAKPFAIIGWDGLLGNSGSGELAGQPVMEDSLQLRRMRGQPIVNSTGQAISDWRFSGGNALDLSGGTIPYNAGASTSTKMVFRSLVADSNQREVWVTPYESSPFDAAASGGDSGWTDERVLQYLGWYEDYILPHMQDMRNDVRYQTEQLREGGGLEGNWYLKTLASLTEIQTSSYETFLKLDLIYDLLSSADGEEGGSLGDLAWSPGQVATIGSPTERVKASLDENTSWLKGPLLPSSSSETGYSGPVYGPTYTLALDLSSYFEIIPPFSVNVDLAPYQGYRDVIHACMLGLLSLWGCGVVWSELRRQ